MVPLHLRPHHLLCLIAFRGRGYSERFVKRMTQLQQRYLAEEPVHLLTGADDACGACPHTDEGEGCLAPMGMDPARLDQKILTGLGLTEGQTITVNDVARAIQTWTQTQAIQMCEGCLWREDAGCTDLILAFAEQTDPS